MRLRCLEGFGLIRLLKGFPTKFVLFGAVRWQLQGPSFGGFCEGSGGLFRGLSSL